MKVARSLSVGNVFLKLVRHETVDLSAPRRALAGRQKLAGDGMKGPNRLNATSILKLALAGYPPLDYPHAGK
jgi:hypothetical protein